METASWFAKEEDWILKSSIIFNKNLLRLTFIEVERLIKLFGGVNESARLLDLCCGIGRHSIQFAKHGFNVTAVDITKPYLEIAAGKAKKEGLDIEFVHSDMRDFCRPGQFDIITNLCTSFGYLESVEADVAVLKNMYESLAPDGKFMIEILGKEVIAATFRKEEHLEAEGCTVLAESRILNDWSMLECKRTIMKDDEQKVITAYHRLYSAAELRGHLRSVGFKNIRVYGDFSGAPYDNNAKSMVMIGDK